MPLLILLAGAFVSYLGAQELMRARASLEWPTTDGTITIAEVERRSTTGEFGSLSHHPNVQYRYEVDGREYRGTRVAYGDHGTSDPQDARTIVDRYPVSSAVRVFYMSGNPGTSLLEPGANGQAWIWFGVGAALFLIGLVMAIVIPIAIRASLHPKP
jgi:hypothetical protein